MVTFNSSPLYINLEEAGNYVQALNNAREMHAPQEIVERLEQKVLYEGFSHRVFDETGEPRPALIELLTITGMEPLKPSQKTIEQINIFAQKTLLRQGERWHPQQERFEALKDRLTPLLKELGFVEGVNPSFNEYEGALVFGASLRRARLRLQDLIERWTAGVRFKNLIIFTGERPLDPSIEGLNDFLNDSYTSLKLKNKDLDNADLPMNESDMIKWIWDNSEIPSEMRKLVHLHLISAPMKSHPITGQLTRPTTEDPIKMWMESEPTPGCYLAVSNSPYINRQDLILRSLTSSQYGFDTIGYPTSETEKMAIYLDELARLIYTQKNLHPK